MSNKTSDRGRHPLKAVMASDMYIVRDGGGFGPPSERARYRVLEDVRQGYVSEESARRDFCVNVWHTSETQQTPCRKIFFAVQTPLPS